MCQWAIGMPGSRMCAIGKFTSNTAVGMMLFSITLLRQPRGPISKYNPLHTITSVGGLNSLSPKPIGAQNPPPHWRKKDRKICVCKVALVFGWTPVTKPSSPNHGLGTAFSSVTPTLTHAGLLYIGFLPKTRVLYGVSGYPSGSCWCRIPCLCWVQAATCWKAIKSYDHRYGG